MQATVMQASPLSILVDGAETPCPAELVEDVTVAVGNRVQVDDRAPRRPLVTGRIRT